MAAITSEVEGSIVYCANWDHQNLTSHGALLAFFKFSAIFYSLSVFESNSKTLQKISLRNGLNFVGINLVMFIWLTNECFVLKLAPDRASLIVIYHLHIAATK